MKIVMKLGALVHCLSCSGIELQAQGMYDPAMEVREIRRLEADGTMGEDGVLYFCPGEARPRGVGCAVFTLEERPGDGGSYAATLLLQNHISGDELYLRILECAAEYLSWTAEMERLVNEPDSIQQIVGASEQYFPFPLVIFNSVGELEARTETIPTSYPPFAEIVRSGHIPPDISNELGPLDAPAAQISQAHGIIVGKARRGDDAINIYRTCFLLGRVTYRCCFFCHMTQPTVEFQCFAEHFFHWIDRYITRNRSRFRSDIENEAYLLRTLMSGSYTDKDYLIRNLSYYNIPQIGNFLLVNVLLKDAEFSKMDVVLQSLRALGGTRCCLYKDGVIALFDLRGQGKAAQKQRNYYLEKTEALLREYDAIAAVSNGFEDIFSVFGAFMQTEKALALVRSIEPVSPRSAFLQGKSRIIHYKEVFVYHLLYDIGDWAIKENEVAVELLRYIEQSRLPRDEILKTLYVHISNGCRYNVTAQLLSLHRNTVANRIEQLEQQLAISLDNFEDCINVILAIKAIECGCTH